MDPNQWFQWGGKNGNDNFLEVNSSGQVNGYGRFTNFTDTYGEQGNVLKKVMLQQDIMLIIQHMELS